MISILLLRGLFSRGNALVVESKFNSVLTGIVSCIAIVYYLKTFYISVLSSDSSEGNLLAVWSEQ